MAASRQEVLREYDKWLDLVEAQWRKPLRKVQPNLLETRFKALQDAIGYAPLASRIPSFQRVHENAERYLGLRDGALIGIALELHRRRHDEYPATLDALVPGLLPALPVDRIIGRSLWYRLADGQPIVYSVGGDLDDDSGRPPAISQIAPPSGIRRQSQFPTATGSSIPRPRR